MRDGNLSYVALATMTVTTSFTKLLTRRPVGNPSAPKPLRTVDLTRYLGRWYEIARYDAIFERNCEAATADYSLTPDGRIKIINSCRRGSIDGPLKTAQGKAYIVKGSGNAKLRVTFFWPFYGDYWVLDHSEDYRWSIVGEPSRRYLWLLSRDPHLPAEDESFIERKTVQLGYDLKLLIRTKHPSRPQAAAASILEPEVHAR